MTETETALYNASRDHHFDERLRLVQDSVDVANLTERLAVIMAGDDD